MTDPDETAAKESAQPPTQAAANPERENETQNIHAWSLADDVGEPFPLADRRSWRIPAVVTAAAIALTVSTGLGIWKWKEHNDARGTTTVPTATVAVHPTSEAAAAQPAPTTQGCHHRRLPRHQPQRHHRRKRRSTENGASTLRRSHWSLTVQRTMWSRRARCTTRSGPRRGQ